MVRELCVKYENIDPVHEMIPVRPVLHYMMGGVHTDTQRRDPAQGPVRRGRGRLREYQRRQPAGLELAQRDTGVRRARRPGRGRVRERGRDAVGEPGAGAGRGRGAAHRKQYLRKTGGTREDLGAARRDAAYDGGRRGIYRDAHSLVEAANKIAEMQERYKAISMEDHSLAFNTQLIAALELGFMLDVAETILQCALAARGIARRPSAHAISPIATTRNSSRIRWCRGARTGGPRSPICR